MITVASLHVPFSRSWTYATIRFTEAPVSTIALTVGASAIVLCLVSELKRFEEVDETHQPFVLVLIVLGCLAHQRLSQCVVHQLPDVRPRFQIARERLAVVAALDLIVALSRARKEPAAAFT